MNKKLFRRLLALALALCLVFSLSACGQGSDDEDSALPHAEAGGSDVPYADGFDTTAKFNTGMNGDTLCIAFNGIQKRDTGYFQPAGDTITLTAAATSDSEQLKSFKAALWKQGEGTAIYVEGATLVFTADGKLYTGSFSGLDPNAKYKVTISYDSGYYTISGGMSISGLVEADAAAND